MWWQIQRLEEIFKQRKKQTLCVRCDLRYKKDLTSCPHCSEVDDNNLADYLKNRGKFRVGLGKVMFFTALVIMLLLMVNSL